MGKGQRSRLARADEVKEKKIAAKKKEKRDKIVRVVSIITTIVLVVGLVGWIGYSVVDSNNRTSGTYLKKDIAVESANFKVTNAQMLYYFQTYYSNFVSSNSDYLSAIGLDTSKSLKEQNYPSAAEDGSTMSWYDYLMNSAVEQVQQTVTLAEAAKAAGVQLTEDEIKEIDGNIENVDPTNYAPGLTKESLRDFMQLALLAGNYQTQVEEAITYTDTDIEKYYKENQTKYDTVDYRMYAFNYQTGEENEAATLSKDEAKKLADQLAATGTEDAYVKWLSDYFTNTLGVSELENELSATLTNDFTYTDGYVGADFLFGNAKAGDIKVIHDETNHSYKVFLLLVPKHRDEETTRTVRHILFKVEDAEDKDAKAAAKKKADDILAKWKANGGTEEAFAALVHDNTDDTGSKETGGLYENFSKGTMVASFEDWSFDAARKKGDTGIVETEYGYHVMYFVGAGKAGWQVTVEKDYKAEKYDNQYTSFVQKHTVEINEKNINKIKSYIA